MRRLFLPCLFAAAAVLAATATQGLAVSASTTAPTTRVIVAFRERLSPAEERAVIARLGGKVLKRLPLINGVAAEMPRSALTRRTAFAAPIARITADGRVQAIPLAATAQDSGLGSWGNVAIGSVAANALSTGEGVKVAVLDTGIAYNHPALVGRVVGGYNVVRGQPNLPRDFFGHGTHVAGIVASVAPDAKIYSVKVLDDDGGGWDSDIIAGLDWAVENDMDIVNMSLGEPFESGELHEAVQRTVAAGVIVVAAAGNSGECWRFDDGGFETEPMPDAECDNVSYPAAFEEAVAVSATNRAGGLARFSSRGPGVDIAAPGYAIRSSVPVGERIAKMLGTRRGVKYAQLSGTSMAAPFVAGVFALMLSANPALDGEAARAALCQSAVDGGDPGRDNRFGCGYLNAAAAVQAVLAP